MRGETRKPNILMVTARYFPYVGGTETHVYEVSRRLAARGMNITILTTMAHAGDVGRSRRAWQGRFRSPSLREPTVPREEEVDGVRILRVQAWPPQHDYYIAPQIVPVIVGGGMPFASSGARGWDIVHCQGCHTFVAPLAMLAAKEAKLPYIVTFHSGGHSSRFRTSMRGVQWRLLRPLLAGASGLIGVSQFEVDYFCDVLGLPAGRFCLIPNGSTLPGAGHPQGVSLHVGAGLADVFAGRATAAPSTTPALAGQDQGPGLETRTGVMNHAPTIVSVGRLERYKGHHHLIRALPRLREWRADVRLLIVGVGAYEDALRGLARKMGVAEFVEIRAIAASDRQGMAEVLSRASLVALLSEYEAHPVAVMEALALGRPVLVADTSGLRELARQKLVRSVPLHSSPEELAMAVRQQIEQPPPHQAAPAADIVLPTWDDCTDQLEKVYKDMIRRA